MFELNNITVKYGNRVILDNTSICGNAGEAIGILGCNGSGKSTLLSYIARTYRNSDAFSVGYVPQENPLFDELNAIDNIKLWTKLNKKQIMAALDGELIKELAISGYAMLPVKKMSGGMKKRVSLAIALLDNPDIILLDEPFAALDIPAKDDILNIMHKLVSRGKTIIVSSHDKDIFDFCNRIYLLKDGVLTDTGTLPSTNYNDMLRN